MSIKSRRNLKILGVALVVLGGSAAVLSVISLFKEITFATACSLITGSGFAIGGSFMVWGKGVKLDK